MLRGSFAARTPIEGACRAFWMDLMHDLFVVFSDESGKSHL